MTGGPTFDIVIHPHQAVQVTFQYPVDIGDLLRFRSTVVHTQQPIAPSTKARCTQLQSPACGCAHDPCQAGRGCQGDVLYPMRSPRSY